MFSWINKSLPQEARTFISCTLLIIFVFGLAYYITHAEDKDAYAVCTIKSHRVQVIGGQASNYTVNSPKGVFETEECGTLEMYGTSDGKRYPNMYLRPKMAKSIRYISLQLTKIKIKTLVLFELKKSMNNNKSLCDYALISMSS